MKKLILSSIIFTSLFLASCGSSTVIYPDKVKTTSEATLPIREYSVQSVMWQQNAAEYRALCYQAFNIAQLRLDEFLASTNLEGKQPAIITDIDETVLDNSPYNAKMIELDEEYSVEGWSNWTAREEARAIPGAKEFLNYAKNKGVEVFYVTNRMTTEMQQTINNMKIVGFPYADENHLFLKSTTSSKKERFEKVRSTHTVLMYLGDNCSDFTHLFEAPSTEKRNQVADNLRHDFGKKFIVLPNPMYGDWEMKGIYQGKYDWSDEEKHKIRKKSLRGY